MFPLPCILSRVLPQSLILGLSHVVHCLHDVWEGSLAQKRRIGEPPLYSLPICNIYLFGNGLAQALHCGRTRQGGNINRIQWQHLLHLLTFSKLAMGTTKGKCCSINNERETDKWCCITDDVRDLATTGHHRDMATTIAIDA